MSDKYFSVHEHLIKYPIEQYEYTSLTQSQLKEQRVFSKEQFNKKKMGTPNLLINLPINTKSYYIKFLMFQSNLINWAILAGKQLRAHHPGLLYKIKESENTKQYTKCSDKILSRCPSCISTQISNTILPEDYQAIVKFGSCSTTLCHLFFRGTSCDI